MAGSLIGLLPGTQVRSARLFCSVNELINLKLELPLQAGPGVPVLNMLGAEEW